MRKKNLKLDVIKVQSFVIEIQHDLQQTLNGGDTSSKTRILACPTADVIDCEENFTAICSGMITHIAADCEGLL